MNERFNLKQRKTLFNLLRVLVEGKNNTQEFLSMASQYTSLEVPDFKDIVDLYQTIEKTSELPKPTYASMTPEEQWEHDKRNGTLDDEY